MITVDYSLNYLILPYYVSFNQKKTDNAVNDYLKITLGETLCRQTIDQAIVDIPNLAYAKIMFLATWSKSKIMHAISDVAVNNQWIQQTGKAGVMFTKSGHPVRFVVEGTYQGIKMRVITTHTDIITAFPIK